MTCIYCQVEEDMDRMQCLPRFVGISRQHKQVMSCQSQVMVIWKRKEKRKQGTLSIQQEVHSFRSQEAKLPSSLMERISFPVSCLCYHCFDDDNVDLVLFPSSIPPPSSRQITSIKRVIRFLSLIQCLFPVLWISQGKCAPWTVNDQSMQCNE